MAGSYPESPWPETFPLFVVVRGRSRLYRPAI